MDTGGGPGAPERHNPLDRGEGEPEPARPAHEGECAEDIGRVGAIPGSRATGRRENPACLVQPQRFAAKSALGRYLANPEPLRHVLSLRPAPRGRVKLYFRASTPAPARVRALVTIGGSNVQNTLGPPRPAAVVDALPAVLR